jgi:hypothetical protein
VVGGGGGWAAGRGGGGGGGGDARASCSSPLDTPLGRALYSEIYILIHMLLSKHINLVKNNYFTGTSGAALPGPGQDDRGHSHPVP